MRYLCYYTWYRLILYQSWSDFVVMMTSKPVNTDSDSDAEILASGEDSYSLEELSQQEKVTAPSVNISQENPSSVDAQKKEEDNTNVRIELPEPDAENITVLTRKLPNKPILPWNRYDSPWRDSEHQEQEITENEEQKELLDTSSPSKIEPEEIIVKPNNNDIELDEVK